MTILVERRGRVVIVRLNRPEALNALNSELMGEMVATMQTLDRDPGVGCFILTGSERVFSAGADIKEMQSKSYLDMFHEDFFAGWDGFAALRTPTIAAVHGYCLGGAMELALACDITIAAHGCRLGEPEVKFGSGIVAMLLPFLCGPKRAKELLLSGNDRVTAEQAEAWGLVNRVCDADRLVHEARALAREIARNDQVTVRLTKQAVNATLEIPRMREALEHALQLDVTIETTETDESRQFNEILRNEGARAAIAWRDRQLD